MVLTIIGLAQTLVYMPMFYLHIIPKINVIWQ